MGSIWESLAVVVSTVVSRAVLDLNTDQKRGKVNQRDVVLRLATNTVKTIME